MAKDVIYSESELNMAKNELSKYASYLSRQMEQFDKILQGVQNCAVDGQIKLGLAVFAGQVRPLAGKVNEIVDEKAANVVKKAISDVKAADTFRYPDSFMNQIIAVLRAFL